MSKPKRPHPLNEGVLGEINSLFVAPFIIYRPFEMTRPIWLETYFHYKERDIVQYVARRNFKMPGLYYEAPLNKIQGRGYRLVKRNSYVMVRHDCREKTYDVEFFGGPGGKEQVFCLDEYEWNSIGANLLEVPARQFRSKKKK